MINLRCFRVPADRVASLRDWMQRLTGRIGELQPWEALGAATWRGGELLGEPEAGALTEGGPADFFLVHGDPLTDPAALWRVWRVAW